MNTGPPPPLVASSRPFQARLDPSNCTSGRWVTLGCRNGHGGQVWIGCGKYDCENCAEAYASKRARRAWKRIGGIKARWAVVILTVPPELRDKLTPDEQGRYWVAVWRTVERWLGNVAGMPGYRMGAVGWFHPTGDNATSWHPHWNLLIPLVAVAKDGTVRPVRTWRGKGDLARLRLEWAETLSRMTGAPAPAGVDVFYEYRTGDGKKRHALRYFGRSFPGWSAWGRTTRWLGILNNATWGARRNGAPGFRDVLHGAGYYEAPDRDPMGCPECGAAWMVLEISPRCAWNPSIARDG